jgi:hypothetical protein
VKTTIEIPDVLFRKAKSKAAERSRSLKEFGSEALREKLASRRGRGRPSEPDRRASRRASIRPSK